jgi:Carboxypeptidase regulatory-like domain
MRYSYIRAAAVLLVALTIVLSASLALGQGIVTGSISGVVEDPQGALIPGAKVTATELGTNRQYAGTSTHTGSFTLNVLPPGQYSVKIEAPSFHTAESQGVTVAVGSDTSLAW